MKLYLLLIQRFCIGTGITEGKEDNQKGVPSTSKTASIKRIEAVYQGIVNNEELFNFLKEENDREEMESISYLTIEEIDDISNFFKLSNTNLEPFLKDKTLSDFLKLAESKSTINELCGEKEFLVDKKTFEETLQSEKDLKSPMILDKGDETSMNLNNTEETSFQTYTTNLISKASSNIDIRSVSEYLSLCKMKCCPLKYCDFLEDLKRKVSDILVPEEEEVLKLRLSYLVAELNCINKIIAGLILNIYPQIVDLILEDKKELFESLEYYQDGRRPSVKDKVLFDKLRRSFIAKRRKYNRMASKCKRKTGKEFIVEDADLRSFQLKIEVVHLILFETLLIDTGII